MICQCGDYDPDCAVCHVKSLVKKREQPANLLLEDSDRPMIYTCKFCGAPSAKDPSEQDMPVDYCWPEDHQ